MKCFLSPRRDTRLLSARSLFPGIRYKTLHSSSIHSDVRASNYPREIINTDYLLSRAYIPLRPFRSNEYRAKGVYARNDLRIFVQRRRQILSFRVPWKRKRVSSSTRSATLHTGEKSIPLRVVGYLPTYLPTYHSPSVRSVRLRPRIYHRGTTSGDTRRHSRLTLDASRGIDGAHVHSTVPSIFKDIHRQIPLSLHRYNSRLFLTVVVERAYSGRGRRIFL